MIPEDRISRIERTLEELEKQVRMLEDQQLVLRSAVSFARFMGPFAVAVLAIIISIVALRLGQ